MTNDGVPTIMEYLKTKDIVKFQYLNFSYNEELTSLDTTNLKNTYGEGVFAIKKDKFMSLNGFEPWLCAADSEFNMRFSMNYRNVGHIPKIVFFRRTHENNLTIHPSTNWKSGLRQKYAQEIQRKKSLSLFGALPYLSISSYFQIKNGELSYYIGDDNIQKTEKQIEIEKTLKEEYEKSLRSINTLNKIQQGNGRMVVTDNSQQQFLVDESKLYYPSTNRNIEALELLMNTTTNVVQRPQINQNDVNKKRQMIANMEQKKTVNKPAQKNKVVPPNFFVTKRNKGFNF
jgi:hypothetical protein